MTSYRRCVTCHNLQKKKRGSSQQERLSRLESEERSSRPAAQSQEDSDEY